MNDKFASMLLWVPLNPEDRERGQRSRRCIVGYEVNGLGAGSLYKIVSIKDYKDGTMYDLDHVLPLNDDMDQRIVAANPTQVAFAKKELGYDPKAIKKRAHKKPAEPKLDADGLPLFD